MLSGFNHAAIESYTDTVIQHFCNAIIEQLLTFYYKGLLEAIVRDDYRELIELSITL